MKKKIMALCLVAVLAVTAIAGATLAYFTDTDAAKNVMTTGNVKIVQNEQERPIDANKQAIANATELQDFTQEKPLYPAVFFNGDRTVKAPDPSSIGSAGAPTWDLAEIAAVSGTEGKYSKKLLDECVANEVDKIVTVTNKGSRPVYVRTVFLMENANVEGTSYQLSDYVLKYWTDNGNQNSGWYNKLSDGKLVSGNLVKLDLIELEGTTYSAYVHYYEDILQPEQTTAASLKQFYLDPNATNEISKLIGDEYTILALSQAVQTDGFTDDRAALDAAFGAVTADNCMEWFAELAK